MNLKKCALLLVAVMLALVSVADAQRAKSKSKAKKRAGASTTALTSQSSQSTQATEHKTEGEVPRITVDELKEKLARNAPVFIIDSRSQSSYDNSEIKIKGAMRIPADEIEARLKDIPHDREIVVYCT